MSGKMHFLLERADFAFYVDVQEEGALMRLFRFEGDPWFFKNSFLMSLGK